MRRRRERLRSSKSSKLVARYVYISRTSGKLATLYNRYTGRVATHDAAREIFIEHVSCHGPPGCLRRW